MTNISKSTRQLLYTITISLTIASCITHTKVDMSDPQKQVDNATLLVLAYPEAICRTTEAAYSNILPYIGIGQKQMIRAGHACLVIAKEGSEKLEYFDNGRYIAPEGFCRVRGENTDPELKIKVKAEWNGKKLANVEEILAWLHAHPEKTHGTGRLYAGVTENVNYEAAIECINIMQDQNIIEYGPFAENGTNCARFVTDVIYNGVLDEEIKSDVESLYYFTPSGLSNIGASNSYDYYYVADGKGVRKSDKSLNEIQLEALFDGGEGYEDYSTSGTLCPPENIKAGKDWQWLGGLGYGAWYCIESAAGEGLYKVSCYNAQGKLNYSALYSCGRSIDLTEKYKITYPSHFEVITLEINNEPVILKKVENLYIAA